MLKIFITGESGTIPMAIQKIASEYDCVIVNSQIEIDNFYAEYKKHQSFQVRKPEVDFLDKELLLKIFTLVKGTKNEPDLIIHSGAFVGTDFCLSNESLAIRTNVEGTLNIVNICNQFKLPLIYFSTTAIMDPHDYNQYHPISENTKICPQTLYGITKYAGELIVQNMCKINKFIVRPVFGFGDYPDDLHSALTKMIYVLYRNVIQKDSSLTILLDPNINKSYTRVENIARCVLRLAHDITSESLYSQHAMNIGVDYSKSKNWNEIKFIMCKIFEEKKICTKKEFNKIYLDKIMFKPQNDYLHYHNIENKQLVSKNIDFENEFGFIDLKEGMEQTIDSVILNVEKEPYWL